MKDKNDNTLVPIVRPLGTMAGERSDTTIGSIILYSNNSKDDEIASKTDKDTIDSLKYRAITPSKIDAKVDDVIKGDINVVKLDGVNDYYGIFNNFLIQSIRENRNTISKVQLNFADSWNVFFFGSSPVSITISGALLDTEDFPYYQEFMTAYDKYISGSKMIQKNKKILVSYDGKVIDGFILNLTSQTSVGMEQVKNFTMTVLVRKEDWVRFNYVDGTLKYNQFTNKDNYKSIIDNKKTEE